MGRERRGERETGSKRRERKGKRFYGIMLLKEVSEKYHQSLGSILCFWVSGTTRSRAVFAKWS